MATRGAGADSGWKGKQMSFRIDLLSRIIHEHARLFTRRCEFERVVNIPGLYRLVSAAAVTTLWLSVMSSAQADVTIPVDSPAARFSPATWAGDSGRGGSVSRTTWNNGAWCRFQWKSASSAPTATLHVTNRTPGSFLSYFVDGQLFDRVAVPAEGGIAIEGLVGTGAHTLTVYTRNSQQTARWQGANAYTVTGLTVEDGATPIPTPPLRPWVLIIGDSITEGIQASANGQDSSLSDYAWLVGQGLNARGFDYTVSACGWSGWIHPGDGDGDVPGYYAVTAAGGYDDAHSRWNRIDARTSLLDSRGHLSADGDTSREPTAIVFNYMVNEALHGAVVADARASVTGALTALRKAAPDTLLFVLVPPGLQNLRVYPQAAPYLDALCKGVADFQATHPRDKRVVLVDLGASVANALASPAYGGGVHPNAAGQAYMAAQILPLLLERLK